MSTMPPPGPGAAPPRATGPGLLTSLLVMGAGLVIGIVAVVAIVIPLAGSFTSPSYAVPGTLQLHLHKAKYTVYQHTETKSTFGSVTPDASFTPLQPEFLSVIAPDQSSVPVGFDSVNDTLTRPNDVYRGILVFDAPMSGTYELNFTNTAPTTVVVSRSIFDAIRGVFVWFGVGALGGAILIGGLVMLIIGVTRRGRAKRAMYAGYGGYNPYGGPPYGGPPPQQWGPPPQWGQTPPPPPPPPGAPPGGPPPDPPSQWGPPPAG